MIIRAVLLTAVVLLQAAASAVQAPTPTPPATATLRGRHPEAGGLLIRQYPPEVYKGGAQNWALLQDSRGVIYVGGTGALLEYDGVT